MEKYRDGWKRVVLMVSPSGEFRAIGGNRAEGEGDTEFLGMTPLQNRIAALEADLAQAKAEIAEWQKEGARRSRIIDERTAERDLATAEIERLKEVTKAAVLCIAENARERIHQVEAERDTLQARVKELEAQVERLRESLSTACTDRNLAMSERDQLRAQLAEMGKPVSELASLSIRLREIGSIIKTHPCTERSKPDYTCGDPGAPPCAWADIDEDSYCDNCKLVSEMKKERRLLKIRRSSIVRSIAARAKGVK